MKKYEEFLIKEYERAYLHMNQQDNQRNEYLRIYSYITVACISASLIFYRLIFSGLRNSEPQKSTELVEIIIIFLLAITGILGIPLNFSIGKFRRQFVHYIRLLNIIRALFIKEVSDEKLNQYKKHPVSRVDRINAPEYYYWKKTLIGAFGIASIVISLESSFLLTFSLFLILYKTHFSIKNCLLYILILIGFFIIIFILEIICFRSQAKYKKPYIN